MFDYPIGTVFEYEGTKLIVSELRDEDNLNCLECYFNYKGLRCGQYACSPFTRKDKQIIAFREVD